MSLIVYKSTNGSEYNDEGGNVGIDLSQIRVNFNLKKMIDPTPIYYMRRIYNLSPQTQDTIKEVWPSVFVGGTSRELWVIFDGTVVQYIQGKENAVDTYFDIWAGEGDAR